MSEPNLEERCFLCNRNFQFGPHAYLGKRIPAWDIMVCLSCYNGNHDGIVPSTYPHLMAHLKSKPVELRYNPKGWLNWPSRSS